MVMLRENTRERDKDLAKALVGSALELGTADEKRSAWCSGLPSREIAVSVRGDGGTLGGLAIPVWGIRRHDRLEY